MRQITLRKKTLFRDRLNNHLVDFIIKKSTDITGTDLLIGTDTTHTIPNSKMEVRSLSLHKSKYSELYSEFWDCPNNGRPAFIDHHRLGFDVLCESGC